MAKRNVAAALFVLLSLTSCQWSHQTPVPFQVEIDPQAIRKVVRGTKLQNISCIFVTVTGKGISPDFGPLKLGARDPQCLGLGVTSKLTKVVTSSSKTRLTVAAGSRRLIRVMGVETNLPSCDGLVLGDMFNGKRPAIFEIARAEADIFIDKRVTINGTNDLTAVTDIVAPCDGTGTAVGGSEELTATGMRVVALGYFNGFRYIRPFSVAPDYSLSPSSDINIGQHVTTRLYLGKTARTFYAVEPAYRREGRPAPGSFIQRFDVDTAGRITQGYSQTLQHSADHISFSDDDRFAYVTTSNAFWQYAIGDTAWNSLPPVVCLINNIRFTAYLGTFFGMFLDTSGSVAVWDSSDISGNRCSSAGTPIPGISGIAQQLTVFKKSSRAFLQTTSGATSTYVSYNMSGSNWTANTPPVIGSALGSNFVVDKAQRVMVMGSAGSKIVSCPISNGGVITCNGNELIAYSPRSLQIDPFGQAVFYLESQGSVKKARIESDLTISNLPGNDLGISLTTDANDLLVVPFY